MKKRAGRPYADTRLAAFLEKRILELKPRKTQLEIATEAGFVHPHYLSMEHPFGEEHEAFQIQEDRNRRDRVALDSDWGTLVHMALEAKRKGGSDADFEPVIEFENGLNTREEVFNEDWKALNKQRSALVDRIRDWYLNQQKQA